MLWHILVDQLKHVPLVAEPLVVESTSLHKLVTQLILVLRPLLCTLLRVVADVPLDVLNRLLQVLFGDLILIFFEVYTAQVVHTTSMFLLIIKLIEDLSHFVIANKCLVVVTFVE